MVGEMTEKHRKVLGQLNQHVEVVSSDEIEWGLDIDKSGKWASPALRWLVSAGLVDKFARGEYKLSDEGMAFLNNEEWPHNIEMVIKRSVGEMRQMAAIFESLYKSACEYSVFDIDVKFYYGMGFQILTQLSKDKIRKFPGGNTFGGLALYNVAFKKYSLQCSSIVKDYYRDCDDGHLLKDLETWLCAVKGDKDHFFEEHVEIEWKINSQGKTLAGEPDERVSLRMYMKQCEGNN